MARAFVFGAGGHAHVIESILDRNVTFLVEGPSTDGDRQMLQSTFFERVDEFRGDDVFIGVGNNDARRRIFGKLTSAGVRVARCVARSAFIARNAQLGDGVVICPGAVVGARALIGDNTIINTLSSVDHDCVLGNHSQVTAGVTFGGTVKTGESCFFGIKSAIVPGIRIGDRVSVMAGSVVARDVPDDMVVGGIPARVIRGPGG